MRVGVRITKRDISEPSMESLTCYQVNHIEVEVLTVRIAMA